MEEHKIFIVLSLLVIYALTISKKLFTVLLVIFISGLLYYKKNLQLSIFFLLFYVLSILLINRKRKKLEKFLERTTENFQENTDNENEENNENNENTENNLSAESISNEEIAKMERTFKVTEKVNNKQFSDSQHSMTMENYQQTFFVLNSLFESEYFEKNKEEIEKILVEYKVKDLFDLSINILNKDQNVIYNNFLEKITCINENGDTNYLDCNNTNYNKLQGFAELNLVFCLDIEKIVELINVHNIYQLCDLAGKRYLLNDGEIETFQYRGLSYYLNEKSFNDKYYEILKILELDKELNNPNMLRETLYNYNDKNKKVVKELNSIMVLFDYFKVFDEVLLNYDELEYNWELVVLKSANLNQPYWDTISYFKKYNLKNRIIKGINKFTKSEEDIFSIEMDEKCKPIEKTTQVEEEEYKVISDNKNNCDTKEELAVLKDLSLDYIIKNFSQKMIDIINDLVQLFNQRCQVDCPDDNSTFSKYIFYFREIMHILSKEERMFFVGILITFIGILLNFVDLSN